MTAYVFRRASLLSRLLEMLIPSRRRAREARLRAGIAWLMDNPDVPVHYE
jgi:hypothetical protein